MPKWRTHLQHGMPLISTGQGRLFLPQGGTALTSSRLPLPWRGPIPTLRQTLLERPITSTHPVRRTLLPILSARPITSTHSVQRTSPRTLSARLGGPSLPVLLETSRRMRSGAQTWCIRRPAMQACRRLLPELRSSSICASRNPTCYPMHWARRPTSYAAGLSDLSPDAIGIAVRGVSAFGIADLSPDARGDLVRLFRCSVDAAIFPESEAIAVFSPSPKPVWCSFVASIAPHAIGITSA